MKGITVPRISANEDIIRIIEINAGANEFVKKENVICVFESTKAVFELEAEEAGYMRFIVKPGDEVRVGEIIAFVNSSPIESAHLPVKTEDRKQPKLRVTKKAEILLKQFNLDAAKIMASGVLKVSDVKNYLHQSGTHADEFDENFAKLETIMKSYEKDKIDFKDVEKIKQALVLMTDIYSKKWNRNIPVVDILFDRWAAAGRFKFGEKSNISHMSYVIGDVKVGKNTFVGPFTIIDGSGGLAIGDNCSIAAGAHVYSHDTIGRTLSAYRSKISRAPTKIGNCCFIGPNAVITKGVTVGDYCFIGANSVVLADIPNYTAVMGIPAKPVGRIEISKKGEVSIRLDNENQ